MNQINEKYQILFTPYKIGNVEIKNRLHMSGMGGNDEVSAEGACTRDSIDYYVERARGGLGLICTGTMTILDREKYKSIEVNLSENLDVETFARTFGHMNERIHSYGAKSMIQLSLGTAPQQIKGVFSPKIICNELTEEDFQYYLNRYRIMAKAAKDAGFDIIEVHAVHTGYILDQIATASTNHRTDEYGGSVENRARFMGEIRQVIREVCGADYPVGIKLGLVTDIYDVNTSAKNPADRVKIFRREVEETVALAREFEKQGYNDISLDSIGKNPPFVDVRIYRADIQKVKDAISIPLMIGGKMFDPDISSEYIREGVCDAATMGRQCFADPDYANKLRSNRFDDIRFCLACNQGCIARNLREQTVKCAINAVAGRETNSDFAPLRRKKNVIIVGGGPAGMEAARVAASRGHSVKLYERDDHLGGAYYPATEFPFRKWGRHLIGWYERQLETLDLEIHMNTEVNSQEIIEQKPDVVIIAAGADEVTPPIKGIESDKVILATDYILNDPKDRDNVVVIGGGMTGAEIALEDAKAGKSVTIVEMQNKILADPSMDSITYGELLSEVKKAGVKLMEGTRLMEVTETGVIVEKDGKRQELKTDVVVLAVGFRPRTKLYNELLNYAGEIYNLGNSKKVANISDAIWAAYEVANGI